MLSGSAGRCDCEEDNPHVGDMDRQLTCCKATCCNALHPALLLNKPIAAAALHTCPQCSAPSRSSGSCVVYRDVTLDHEQHTALHTSKAAGLSVGPCKEQQTHLN